MAQHKSAVKRIRRNDRANDRNSQYLSTVRTAVKRFRIAVAGAKSTADQTSLQPLLVTAQSLLAKAAAKGLIHTNNAARKISRLTQLLRTAGTKPTIVEKKPTKKAAAAAATATTTAAAKKPVAAKKPAAAKAAPAKKPAPKKK